MKTTIPCRLATAVSLLLLAGQAAAAPAARAPATRPIPVILDTDIGDDMDDTWALALLLRSPELDLRLVVADFGDTLQRARLTAKLLETAGRSDVPIGIGVRAWAKELRQAEWIGDYSLARYRGRVHEDGAQALVDVVMRSSEPVTLIAIGPPTTVQAALEREPRIAAKLRLVGMYGSLREGNTAGSPPEPEWNVKSDLPAARALLAARWRDAIVTPLDTCARVKLDGERYARLFASKDPLVRAVIENYRLWCPHADWCTGNEPWRLRSTTLFDTVAVYLAFAQDLVEIERTGIRVTDTGMTLPDPQAPALGWATAWKDLDAFRELLTERLLAGPARVPRSR